MKGIVGAVVATLLIAGIAYAAWSLTKSKQATGEVLGTYAISEPVCGSAVEGETAVCTVTITNLFDGPVYYARPTSDWPPSSMVITTDRADVTLGAPVQTYDGGAETNIPVGEHHEWEWTYTPDVGAALGAVDMNFEVTMQDTLP
jgi:hypothetical protein